MMVVTPLIGGWSWQRAEIFIENHEESLPSSDSSFLKCFDATDFLNMNGTRPSKQPR